jgi:hypothetical protein
MDLLIVLAFVAVGCSAVCVAAGMLGDAIAFGAVAVLLIVAAVGVAARHERGRR